MSLYRHAVAASAKRRTDVGTHLRLRHERIQNIHAAIHRGMHNARHGFGRFSLQMLAAKPDFRNRNSRFPQCTIFHILLLLT